MSPQCALIVFAKAPMAGFAKTRLIPALGEVGAAHLADRLLAHALAQACAAAIGPVELCCWPDTSHPAFQNLAQVHGVTLSDQGEGDLGEKMARALGRALQTHQGAIVMGTDAPGVDALYLQDAAAALQYQDAVFGPALDGGYTLVGLRAAQPALFDAMPWSTSSVMGETRLRLARLGIAHAELAVLSDVDEPADLAHLKPEWLSAILGREMAASIQK